MAENLGSLLSPEAREGDWQVLGENIKNAILQIKELIATSKEITFNIKGDDLLGLIEKVKKSEEVFASANESLKKSETLYQSLGNITANYGEKVAALIPTYADLKAQININNDEIKKYQQGIKGAEDALTKFGTVILKNEEFAKQYNSIIKENESQVAKLQATNFTLITTLNTIAAIEKDLISTNIKLAKSDSDSAQALTEKKLALAQTSKQLLLNAKMEEEAFEKEVQIRVQQRLLNQEYQREVRFQTGEYQASLQKQIEIEERKALKAELSAKKVAEANDSEFQANKKLELSVLGLQVVQENASVETAKFNAAKQQQAYLNKLNAQLELAEVGSIEQANIQIRIAQIELKKLTEIESEENKILAEQIRLRIEERTEFVRRNSASPTQQAMQIGDYKSANSALQNARQQMIALQMAGKGATAEYKALQAEAIKLASAQRQVGTDTGVARREFLSFKEVTNGVLMGLGIFSLAMMIMQAVNAIKEFVSESVDLYRSSEGVRLAFGRLNDPNLLANLREATKGTVSDLELMRQAVKANNLEIPINKLATAFAFARERARETGLTMEDIINRVVQGIGRNSVRLLEPLGFSYNRLREETEKMGSFSDAVFSLMENDVKKVRIEIQTTADRVEYLNTKIANQKSVWGEFGSFVSEVYKNLAMDLVEFITLQDLAFNNTKRASELYKLQQKQKKEEAAIGKEVAKIYEENFQELSKQLDKADKKQIDSIKETAIEREAILKKELYGELLAYNEHARHLTDPALLEANRTITEGLRNNIEAVTRAYEKFNQQANATKLTRQKVPISQLDGLALEQLKTLKESVEAEYNPLTAKDTKKSRELTDYYDEVQKRIDLIEGKEKKAKGGARNGLSPLEKTLDGNKKLLEALERLNEERLKNEIEKEKEITDNLLEEEQKRLDANIRYAALRTEVANGEFKKEFAVQQESIENSIKHEAQLQQKLHELKPKSQGGLGKGNFNSSQRNAAIRNVKDEIENEGKLRQSFLVNQETSIKRFNAQFTQIQIDEAKKKKEILKQEEAQYLSSRELVFAQQKQQELQASLQQELALKEQHDKGLIGDNQYYYQREQLQKHSNDVLIDANLEFYNSILNDEKERQRMSLEEINEYTKKRDEALKAKINNDDSKKPKKGNITDGLVDLLQSGLPENEKLQGDALLNAKKEFWNQTVNLAQEAYSSLKTIRDNHFQQEQMNIQHEMQLVQMQANQKIAAIRATSGYEKDKLNQEAVLVAQTNAKENELQKESNQLNLKKAKADKTSAELEIVAKTGVAIAATYAAYAGIPGGVLIASGIAALLSGIGAAQFAAVASTPLPQYYMGGTTKTPIFSAGERGFELIQPAGNKPAYFSSNTASVYNEPIGTKITSHEQTVKLIKYAVGNVLSPAANQSSSNVLSLQKSENDMTKKIVKELANIIGDKFEDTGDNITYAIMKSKPNIRVYNNANNNSKLTWKI